MVVMHEANLHHLIADLTINRNDWDGYVREVGRNHGPGGAGLRRALRADAAARAGLQSGDDADRARSARAGRSSTATRWARNCARRDSKVPSPEFLHGAWTAPVDRMSYRARLGLDGAYSADRRVRIPQAVQAHRRIAAGVSQAGARRAGRPHDPGGRGASGAAAPIADRVDGPAAARAPSGFRSHGGFQRLPGRLRHRAEPALSDGGRKLGNAAAGAGHGQGRDRIRRGILPRASR